MAAIEDAKNVVTRAAYNAIGQRSSVSDPNQGAWSFVYNALGEVTSQTDARGIVTAISYDKLGRPISRTATVDVTGDNVADTVADSWSYDPANAKGAPLSEQRSINGTLERSETTTYDTLARPVQTDVVQALTAGTQTYTLKTRYDSYYGRPVGQRFPNGETLQVVYGLYGDALAEQDPVAGTEYRRLNSVNARGQATQETFGNGVALTPQYLATTGQLTELRYSKNGSDLRTLGYGYDVFGNLTRQTLNGGQSQEDYQYDQLHRLVQSLRSGAASGTVSYGFDAVGNFTKKTDFSANTANAYVYTGGSCGGGANAVKQITLANNTIRTFCYDANGNLTSDNAGLSLKYDHQNMLTVAQRGALRDDFRYGADGMRTRSWGADGSRVYLPGYEHRLDTNETKVYVGDYAVITSGGGTPRKIDYLLKDRLGSVDAITNSSGTVTETRGYDAFGKPRSGTWTDLNPAKMSSTAVTPKGFTQHEHLNQLELIHMNGRVFDYNVGRFTGVDPFIQFPLNSQSLNPYSYIFNNPLSGTDPTGYCAESDTGTRVRDCATVTVTMTDGSTQAETYNKRSSADVARAFATPIPGMGNGGGSRPNGSSSGSSAVGANSRKDQAAAANEKGSTQNLATTSTPGQNEDVSSPSLENDDQRKQARGRRDSTEIVPADPKVIRAATSAGLRVMSSIYKKGGYKDRDQLAKDLDAALVPLTNDWHVEFGLKIFEQSGLYYPGTLVVGTEICTPNAICGVNVGLSEFSGQGEAYVAGDYHSHPDVTGKGFSYSDIVSSFVIMDLEKRKSGSRNYISYVSSRYYPLERIDFRKFKDKDPGFIYHSSKKNPDLVR